jgi:hypothetical protein
MKILVVFVHPFYLTRPFKFGQKVLFCGGGGFFEARKGDRWRSHNGDV